MCVCVVFVTALPPEGLRPIDRKSTGPRPTHTPNQPEKRGDPKREHTTQNVTGTLCRRAPRRKGAKPTMQQSHRTTTRATGPRPQNHRGACFGLHSKNDPEKSAEKHTPTYSTLPQALETPHFPKTFSSTLVTLGSKRGSELRRGSVCWADMCLIFRMNCVI